MPILDVLATITREKPTVKTIVLIAGMSLYAISLCDVAFCTSNECVESIMALLLGWAGIVSGGAAFSWIANPMLVEAWRLLAKNKKNAWIFGLLAALFSISFLAFKTVIANEAGTYSTILKIGISYWFWLASCVTTFVGSVILSLLHKK